MGRRGRHKQKHFARIHAFTCGKSGFKHEHSLVGGPGFSRVVHCNDPEGFEASMLAYESNYVRTTKYTIATFLPRSFFEQFRRVANIYFLLCAILSFTPLAPYSAVSNVIPLVVVIAATMVKELVEDWGRKQQDIEVNNRKVKVNCGNGVFNHTKWRDLRVGDIVRVEKDEFFPADLILLSSSFEDAICYVETMNLDGETNLKLKQALDATSKLQEESSFVDFKATVKCEDPNPNLYTFVGTLELEQQQHPLTPQQLLLRDSKLRNTDHVYGVVIFTGNDTKVMQNSTAPPSKRSKIERRMDKIIFCLFGLLVLIAAIGSVVFGINTRGDLNDGRSRWYLRPESTTVYFDPRRAPAAAILHFFTAIMLYNYLIPISLYISIEIVKVLQSVFINQDLNMYYEEGDKPARARTSNLNEELGQVDTVLSDKTGTLTCNSMEFIKCSVAGTSYGRGITEVERSMARRKGEPSLQKVTDEEAPPVEHTEEKKTVAGYNFIDERITDGFWVNEPHADVIQKFLKTLAVCHTAIPEIDEETGSISYEAESPDESAFVIAAREMGFEFFERTQTSVLLNELDLRTGAKVERHYKLLNIIEFSSARKRMSVIVRDEDGKLLLLCKGADSVMFERLANDGREFEPVTREHINGYADAGLRTLILAYRKLSEEEYNEFNREFTQAKNAVSADRDDLMDAAALKIEGNLTLLGATAVEDKLQNGVPECIDKLAQAGIKIWVLTGDKMETAINIGFACSLLRQGMRQITISSETPERKIIDRMEDKVAAARAAKEVVLRQLTEGKTFLTPPSTESTEALALIIDGSSLTYALEDDVQDAFLELAVGCASVICCRSSPKQKAMVTRLVKVKTGKTTLGVGDGANDVGMLQEADIGVGISGVEGMQAVMSSDFAIAQFRFLERLLLVHGHWCYKRISSMICYFFYKNIAFGMTLFFFESFTSFSSQTPYNDWYMSLYNVFFTSLPVLAMGVLDKDLSARYCLKFPLLYQEGVQNTMFSWFRISGWAFNGMMVSVMVTFLSVRALDYHAFRETGQVVTLEILGTSMYTCLVWIVNCQMALSIGYFTYIQHIFIWGEIIFWYIFMLAYGEADPGLSSTAYGAFVEACAPAPAFWLTTLTVTVSALVPYFAVSAIRMRFYPSYHQMIQWMKVDGHTEDPAYCQMVRQRSIRPTTVGSTARLAASSRRSRPSEGSPLPTT